MPALTADRNTPELQGGLYAHSVAAGAVIFAGGLVMLNATGFAMAGATATGLVCVGRAEEAVDNSSGIDGDELLTARRGVFGFANDGSVNRAHIGKSAYVVDDQTLAATDGTGTRSVAGVIMSVGADGVYVQI